MLSQNDRQQLELISNRLRAEDPDLAKALRDGKPPPTPVNRRWPYLLLAILALLVLAAGVVLASFGFLFLGGAALALIVVFYRRQVRRSPRLKVSRRKLTS